MKELVLHSCAKLNLYLAVRSRRKDNYHNIKTLFERIDLSDKIILKSRPKDKEITVISNLSSLPKNYRNLAYRSAKLLQESLKINKGAEIKIIKRIPMGSGLGGGSSNAASVLLGLNKTWGLNLSQKKLIEYAKQIGADVPFFLYDTNFAIGEGRGDKIRPLRIKNRRFWHVLVVPKIEVSTALIYKKWDNLKTDKKLTIPKSDVKILILGLKKYNLDLVGEHLFNCLEEVTSRLYPQVNQAIERLKTLGLNAILMSGSGPAVFGLVSSRKEAQKLCRQLKRESRLWQVFVTKTV